MRPYIKDWRIMGRIPPDNAEQAAWRQAQAKALAAVRVERERHYPKITTENADEVIAWQEARIKALIAEFTRPT